MIDINAVRLLVGGREFGGWKSVRIEAGIERAARSFDLGVTEVWPGSMQARARVNPGDLCELFIGPDRVLTGFVDAAPLSYDGRSNTVQIKGRSLTADLVDCSAINEPGQWRGLPVEAIVSALAQPYGVSVVTQVDTGPVIDDHQIEPGEAVFDSIDKLLKLRQLLASDDADGRLVLLQAGSGGRATAGLQLGVNVLSGQAGRDYSRVFGEYICKGQRAATTDEEWTEDIGEQVASAVQPGLSRRRVLVLKQDGQADNKACQDRVNFERDYRMTRAREISYVVNGWRQSERGPLWLPNLLVRVVDQAVGVDETMLTAEVAWTLDENGMRTEIKVGPPEGYLSELARPEKQGGAGGKTVAKVVDPWAGLK